MTAILDPEPLHLLAEDVGAAAAHDFARRWLATLDPRITRLRRAVLDCDLDDGYAAALSLQTSASMVGANLLSRRALAFAHAARHGLGWPALRALVDLGAAARQTTAELTTVLRESSPLAAEPYCSG